jgi:hypothetical protein
MQTSLKQSEIPEGKEGETFIETCQRMRRQGYEFNMDSGYFELTWDAVKNPWKYLGAK